MLIAIKKILIEGIPAYQPMVKSSINSTEYTEQVNLINWLDYNHEDVFYFATVNERNSSKQDMVKLKRQGLVTGVPDLYLSYNEKSLFVEMKKHNGTPSNLRGSQREIAHNIIESGQSVVVCFGFSAAKAAIIEFFGLEK